MSRFLMQELLCQSYKIEKTKKTTPFVLFYYCIKYFTTYLFYIEVKILLLQSTFSSMDANLPLTLSNRNLLNPVSSPLFIFFLRRS